MALTSQEAVSNGFVQDLTGRQVVTLASTGVGTINVQSIALSTAASGQTQLVAANATNSIVVTSFALVASSAVTAQFQGGSTALTGAMALAANGGISSSPTGGPLFATGVDQPLNINLGGAVQVSGFVTYYLLGSAPTTASLLPTRIAESTGTIFYVNASTGSDARTSAQAQNPATPWLTISNAVSQVASLGVTTIAGGPIIEVAAGTYTEQVQVFQAGANGDASHVLTIRGAGGSRPIIQHIANNSSAVTLFSTYTRIRNFAINGTTQTTAGGDGAALGYTATPAANCEWDNVIAHDIIPRPDQATPPAHQQRVAGFFVDACNNIQHWNCQAFNIDPGNVGTPINSHCWYVAGTNSYRVNCVGHHANGFAFQSYNGGGITPRPTNSGDIECSANACTAGGFLVDDNYVNYVAANCVSANGGVYGFRGFASGAGGGSSTVINSLTFNNVSGTVHADAGSPLTSANMLDANPLFTSSTDLHISSSSPAIGIGSSAYKTALDADGLARVSTDAGAYRHL